MYFHVMLGTECNSQCRYCYDKSCNDFGNDLSKRFKIDFSMPPTIQYDIKDLKHFIEKGDKNNKHVLTFYGGEPLMHVDKIKEIMDLIPSARYMMQTNGLLFDKLHSKYLNRFDVILISIDGDKEITDFNRGKGTYERVMKNIKLIKENGFNGELIARMVVDEHSMLLKQVKHLVSVGFTSIHWQLDAGFYGEDYAKRDFAGFSKRYNQEVRELVDFWIEEMKKGRVSRIYPFVGFFESLFYGKKEKLRCGSGFANYTIAPDGKISVCPIMQDWVDFQVGDIKTSKPDDLREISVGEPCVSCKDLDLCGGRCLYANQAKLWPKEGQELICQTVRELINAIQDKLPVIKELISRKVVLEEDFKYEKYTGPEIIP